MRRKPDYLLLTGRNGGAYLLPISPAAIEFNDLNSTYGCPRVEAIEPQWLPAVLDTLKESGLTVARSRWPAQ